MNFKRRQMLKKALAYIESADSLISAVKDEESDAAANYPENLQCTDTYQAMENAVDMLEEAQELLSEADSAVNKAIDGL